MPPKIVEQVCEGACELQLRCYGETDYRVEEYNNGALTESHRFDTPREAQDRFDRVKSGFLWEIKHWDREANASKPGRGLANELEYNPTREAALIDCILNGPKLVETCLDQHPCYSTPSLALVKRSGGKETTKYYVRYVSGKGIATERFEALSSAKKRFDELKATQGREKQRSRDYWRSRRMLPD